MFCLSDRRRKRCNTLAFRKSIIQYLHLKVYDNTWEGVSIREILRRAKPLPSAKFVMAHSWTGYTTNLPLADLDVMIALKHDG